MSSSQSIIQKYSGNPVFTFKDVPWHCTMAYNPGCVRTPDGKYALIFRSDDLPEKYLNEGQINTLGVKPSEKLYLCVGLALSDDGINFKAHPEPILRPTPEEADTCYDPRATVVEGTYCICYTTDPETGIQSCIATSKDLYNWERVYRSEPDNRNSVLFPEKVNGLYVKLDRPFSRQYNPERGYDIWISRSPDMEFWGHHKLVLHHDDVPWGNAKIGPGTPPIRTDEGWLSLFHGVLAREVDKTGWGKTYHAGVMLLDLKDPSRIIAISPEAILEPEEEYEMMGYRGDVVFPGAMLPEPDGTVKIYYGVADQSVALATAKIDDLLAACTLKIEPRLPGPAV